MLKVAVHKWWSEKVNRGPAGYRAPGSSHHECCLAEEETGLWAMALLGLSWESWTTPLPHSLGGFKAGSGVKGFVHYKDSL